MVSISIRKDIVPLNSIIIQTDSKKPLGWSDETSLYGKYVKATANAAANPGGANGNANHQHATSGNHNHTGNTGNAHTHSVNLTNPLLTGNPSNYSTGGNIGQPYISHTHTSGSNNPGDLGAVTATSDGGHQHAAETNDIAHKTEFFLKHSETTIGLRRRAIGQNSLFMWAKSAANLPARYVKDTGLNDTHVKGVATANSTPGVAGGSHNHTHDAHAAHSHTVTLPSHTHSCNTSSNAPSAQENLTYTGTINVGPNHAHTPGALAASTAANIVSNTGTVATHPSQSKEVAWQSIHYVKQTSVGMREGGLPVGSIVLWLDAVANIPTGWQVADGNNGTSTFLDKYPRGESGNTNAGATGGANTHTHAAGGGTHLHNAGNMSHNHSATNSGSAAYQFNNYNAKTGNTFGGSLVNTSHTHTLSIASANANGNLQNDTDVHTHDSQNHEPPGVSVAFIERLA